MKPHHVLRSLQNFLSGTRKRPETPPPHFLSFRSSVLFINTTISFAIFTDIFFYGLIVPVIPFSLTQQVGIPPDQVQTWTAVLLACYNATLCLSSPLIGWFADRTTSRRFPMVLGLLALAGSTLLLCLGKSIGLLVIGRLLQGISASVVWSVGLALLADTVGRDIGKYLGYTSVALSCGLLISPTIGGVVYERAGYYAVYYVAFGVIFLDIVLRLLLIEKKVARQWTESSDEPGAEEVAPTSEERDGGTSDGGLRLLKSPASTDPAASGQAQPLSGPSDSTAARDVRKRKNPNLILICDSRVLAALFGCVMDAGAMFAFDTIIPLHVKDVFHWNSTAAGLLFITIMVPGFTAPLVGMLSDRYGAKWPALFGFIASLPLFVCLRYVNHDSISQKVLLCVILGLLGLTITFSNTPLMAEITYAVDDKERCHPGIWGEKGVYGIAYGLYTTAFALGGTVGSIMSGEIVANFGWEPVTWSLAIWYVAAIPVVAIWLGGRLDGKKPSSAEMQNADVEATASMGETEAREK